MEQQSYWVQTTDQQRLYVKTWGNANNPVLVLVHGYPDNQEVWEPVIRHLVQDYYIVTYDVRGAGMSSVPRRTRAYALPQLSLDLESVVNSVIPQLSFHLVAHDWGSIQSWESATEPKFRERMLSFTTISGPCLDHAAFWMREQFVQHKPQFFKQLTKSWYIAAFQLPFLAPTVWQFFSPKQWSKILSRLEGRSDLPLNHHIAADGKHGVALYRANFIPRLTKHRERFAICPVLAIVLEKDQFVSPALIDEMPKWVENFQRVNVNANHWAILSQPEVIAKEIKRFVQNWRCVEAS